MEVELQKAEIERENKELREVRKNFFLFGVGLNTFSHNVCVCARMHVYVKAMYASQSIKFKMNLFLSLQSNFRFLSFQAVNSFKESCEKHEMLEESYASLEVEFTRVSKVLDNTKESLSKV